MSVWCIYRGCSSPTCVSFRADLQASRNYKQLLHVIYVGPIKHNHGIVCNIHIYIVWANIVWCEYSLGNQLSLVHGHRCLSFRVQVCWYLGNIPNINSIMQYCEFLVKQYKLIKVNISKLIINFALEVVIHVLR